VAFSPDGRQIATGSWDYTAKIWTAAAPKQAAFWRHEEKEDEDRLQRVAIPPL
jgi:WD40 repeat protein